MLFDTRSAEYLAACTKLITTPQSPEVMDKVRPYLTNRCSECGEVVNIFATHHVVVADGQDGTGAYVVIGCEGYWLINPNVVGVKNIDWQDWTKPVDSPDGTWGTWADADPNMTSDEFVRRILG